MAGVRIPILEPSAQITRARTQWQHTGAQRPDFAEEPANGQRSVWDFPRPPRIRAVDEVLRVFHEKTPVAETQRGVCVEETAGAPTYYFPPGDVDSDLVTFGDLASICEWKGVAQTLTVCGIHDAGWRYVKMFEEFQDLFEWPAFYPNKLLCFVGKELVQPQPGGYYGGWVTSDLAGPIKGGPGSQGW